MRASSADHATIALARCPLQLDDGSFSNSHRPSSEGTFRVDAPECTPIYAVDRGLAMLCLSAGGSCVSAYGDRFCKNPGALWNGKNHSCSARPESQAVACSACDTAAAKKEAPGMSCMPHADLCPYPLARPRPGGGPPAGPGLPGHRPSDLGRSAHGGRQ